MQWSKHQINKASKMWRDGKPVKAIADKFGVSEKTIWRCASQYREYFPKRELVKSYNKKQLSTAAQLWNAGHGAIYIAREIGVAVSTFYNMRKANAALFTRDAEPNKLDSSISTYRVALYEEKPIKLVGCLPIIVVPLPLSKAIDEKRCLYFAADIMSHEGLDMPVCGLPRMKGIRQPYCEQHYHASHYVGASHD